MKNKNRLIILLGILLALSVFLNIWSFKEIYWIGGWRFRVESLAGTLATVMAMEHWKDGKMRLYELKNEISAPEHSGTNSGNFEIWYYPSYSEITKAYELSSEKYVEAYNSKMRHMFNHPENFGRPKGGSQDTEPTVRNSAQ